MVSINRIFIWTAWVRQYEQWVITYDLWTSSKKLLECLECGNLFVRKFVIAGLSLCESNAKVLMIIARDFEQKLPFDLKIRFVPLSLVCLKNAHTNLPSRERETFPRSPLFITDRFPIRIMCSISQELNGLTHIKYRRRQYFVDRINNIRNSQIPSTLGMKKNAFH